MGSDAKPMDRLQGSFIYLPSYFNYYQDSQKMLACSRLQDNNVQSRNEKRVGTTTHLTS